MSQHALALAPDYHCADVDLSANPVLPPELILGGGKSVVDIRLGLAAFEHYDGQLRVGGREMVFTLSMRQDGGLDLPASFGDFLLNRPEFIPDDAPPMYFWGTQPVDKDGHPYVSVLCRWMGKWESGWIPVADVLRTDVLAARLR